jgi:hypothetical protein
VTEEVMQAAETSPYSDTVEAMKLDFAEIDYNSYSPAPASASVR